MKPILVVTIDAEPDDVWRNGRTTKNARFLPRFQRMCESYELKPTYLTTYEMALDEQFHMMGRDVLARGTAEIGAHLHAWASPPFGEHETSRNSHTYVTELSESLARAKLSFLTQLLLDAFDVQPRSHRAGRWGFNEMTARLLIELGYRTDCSVTPGVSWRAHKGMSEGGPDYFGFSVTPYFLDLSDISRPGKSSLLEIPVTICPAYPGPVLQLYHAIGTRWNLAEGVLNALAGRPYLWLRPMPILGNNLKEMLHVVDWAMDRDLTVIEFMMHSSELMPGGSPYFANEEDVVRLYADLDMLFQYVNSRGIRGATLSECRDLITCKSG